MTDQDSTTVLGGRVLVVAHAWYGDLIGGTFRLASEFAADLAAAGCEVDYVCCAPADLDGCPEHERINGLTVHRYPALRRRSWPIGRMRHHVRQTVRIVEQLAGEHTYGAVSGHSPLQSRGAFQVMRRRQPQAFLNYTVHSPFDDEMVANAISPLARRPVAEVAGWVDRRNLAMADRVQTCSQYTLSVLKRKYPRLVADKGRVAPGWVNFERYSSTREADPNGRLPRQSTPYGAPVFFTLRRLEARMGLETLIDASALLRDQGLPFQVVIGGNGSLRESLERQVRDLQLTDRVQFIGRVTEPDLPMRYAAADCFILPTRALECFGLIVLEAFAAGTPVIASRAAAIPELADRQGPGWDFEPGDAHGLAQRMEAFINGDLRPSADLPRIAAEFDRSTLFPEIAHTPVPRETSRIVGSAAEKQPQFPIPAIGQHGCRRPLIMRTAGGLRSIEWLSGLLLGRLQFKRPAVDDPDPILLMAAVHEDVDCASPQIRVDADACPSPHSTRNKVVRVLWSVTWWTLFRPTPRIAFGWRRFLLRMFGATVGRNARISPAARFWAPWNVTIGDEASIAHNVDCYSVDQVSVGNHATVSQYVFLCTAGHDVSDPNMRLTHAPIRIGDQAWVCAGAFVSPGVTIGAGAVAGARAVVTRDVAPWTIVAGNPARHLRDRVLGAPGEPS